MTGFNIDKGIIEVTLGETDSTKKLLSIDWRLQFNHKTEATKYFEKLKQIFNNVSTYKKLGFDKYAGHMAQFSTRKPTDIGVRDITLFLNKLPTSKKYEIALLFGNELMDE